MTCTLLSKGSIQVWEAAYYYGGYAGFVCAYSGGDWCWTRREQYLPDTTAAQDQAALLEYNYYARSYDRGLMCGDEGYNFRVRVTWMSVLFVSIGTIVVTFIKIAVQSAFQLGSSDGIGGWIWRLFVWAIGAGLVLYDEISTLMLWSRFAEAGQLKPVIIMGWIEMGKATVTVLALLPLWLPCVRKNAVIRRYILCSLNDKEFTTRRWVDFLLWLFLLCPIVAIGCTFLGMITASMAYSHSYYGSSIFTRSMVNQDAAVLFRNVALAFFIVPNAFMVFNHLVLLWRANNKVKPRDAKYVAAGGEGGGAERQQPPSASDFESGLAALQLGEALFESAPQLAVQAYLWTTGKASAPAWGFNGALASIMASTAAFWWALCHDLYTSIKVVHKQWGRGRAPPPPPASPQATTAAPAIGVPAMRAGPDGGRPATATIQMHAYG